MTFTISNVLISEVIFFGKRSSVLTWNQIYFFCQASAFSTIFPSMAVVSKR